MSEIETTVKKDEDEFYDALSDAATSQTSKEQQTPEQIVQDILKEQDDKTKLPDEVTQTEENTENPKKGDDQPEVFDDVIDEEEEQRERDKGLSAEELQNNKEEAEKLKLEGNELFKADKALEAIEIYSSALRICPMAQTKDRAMLYGNRAAAKIKIDSKKSAIEDCTKAIELWPEYVRVILR